MSLFPLSPGQLVGKTIYCSEDNELRRVDAGQDQVVGFDVRKGSHSKGKLMRTKTWQKPFLPIPGSPWVRYDFHMPVSLNNLRTRGFLEEISLAEAYARNEVYRQQAEELPPAYQKVYRVTQKALGYKLFIQPVVRNSLLKTQWFGRSEF